MAQNKNWIFKKRLSVCILEINLLKYYFKNLCKIEGNPVLFNAFYRCHIKIHIITHLFSQFALESALVEKPSAVDDC